MARFARSGIVVLLFALISARAFAYTYTWTGTTSTAWNLAGNWTSGNGGTGYPGDGGTPSPQQDTANIATAASGRYPTVSTALPSALIAVNISGNAALTVGINFTTQTLSMSSSTASVTANSNFSITVQDSVSITAGAVSGTGTITWVLTGAIGSSPHSFSSTASIGAITVNTAQTIDINAPALTLSGTLTIQAGTCTLATDINVGGVSITGGTFNAGSGTIATTGAWNKSAGTFNANTSTVEFTNNGVSAGLTTGGSSFYNFTANDTVIILPGSTNGVVTMNDNLSVLNVLTTGPNSFLAVRGFTITIGSAGLGGFVNQGIVALHGTAGEVITFAGNAVMDTLEGTVWYDGGTSTTIPYMSTYFNLHFDNRVGGAVTFTLNASGDIAVNGTLTIAGTAANTSGLNTNGKNITVVGDVLINGTGTLTAGTSIITVAGNWTNSGSFTTTGTVALNGGVTTGGRIPQTVSGTLTGGTGAFNNLTITGATTVADFGGNNFAITSLTNGGTLELDGSQATQTISGGAGASGLILYKGGSGGTVVVAGPFYDLQVNGAGTFGLNANITVNHNLSISGGILSAATRTISIAGSWSNTVGTGGFTAGSGTVSFTGAATATISGDTIFNVLSCIAAGKVLQFTAGSTQQMATLTITGASGNLISLLSTVLGSQWTLNPSGAQTVTWTYVQDGKVTGASAITANTSTNAGNNTIAPPSPGWTFPAPTGFTWVGGAAAGPTNWNVGANWNRNYVPGVLDTVTISAGANQPTLTTAVAVAGITINNAAGNLTTNGLALTVTGALAVGPGKVTATGTETISVAGNLSFAGGTFTAASSTVAMTGTSTVTTPSSFYNFTVNAPTFTVTLGSAITASNNLTITAGTLDVSGTNYGITVGVNWSNSGTFTPRAGTVTFNGAGAIQNAESFANVTVSAGARTDGFGLTVGTLLQVSGGSLALNAASAVTASIGTLTLNGGTMSTTNPVTLNVTVGNFTVNNAGSTFTGGTGAVTVSAGNLVVSAGGVTFGGTAGISGATGDGLISGGTVTNNGLLTVNRNLTMTGGTLSGTGGIQVNGAVSLSTAGTFNGNARTVTVVGNWTESAAIFAAGTSTVAMTGTSTVTATSSFYNFTVNAPTFTVLLGSPIVVSNNLTITAGTLDVSGTNYGISVGVNWSNSGAFAPRAGTVTFNGAGAIQNAESFANVTVSAGARTDGFGLTVGSLLQVSGGSLALNAGGAVTASIGTLTLNGGTMSTANPVTLNVTVGNFTVNNAGSTFTGGTGAVTVSAGNLAVSAGGVTFGGTAGISGATGDGLISGGTVTNNGLLTVNRNLTMTAGTLSGTGGIQVNGAVSLSTAGTFNGNARTVTVVGNWTESAAIFAAGTSTVAMTGTSTVTATSSFYNFTVNAPTFTVLLGSAITVTNNLTITAGTLDVSGTNYGISVGVNWSNSGAFAPRAGTVTFNGAGAIQNAESFANVTVSAGARTDGFGLTVGSLLQVSGGSLALNAGGAVTASIGTLTLNGGTMSTANPVTLNVTVGNFTVNNAGSTFTGGTGAVTVSAGNLAVSAGGVTFGGTAGISGATGDGLISGGTVTNNGLLTVNRNLTMTAGTLSGTGGIQVNGAVSLSTAGTFNGNARTVTVVGNWTESAAIFAAGTSTVAMTGTSTVTATSSFYNFTVNAPTFTVLLGSAITVTNNLTITAGTLDVSGTNYGISVGVNWSNSGTFTAQGGTVTFNGAAAQTVTAGGSSFYNFTVSSGANTVSLGVGGIVVSNNLSITSGTLDVTAANNYPIAVGVNWNRSGGSFLAQAGTVTFNGAGAIQNAESFANVTVSAGARTDGFGLTVSGLLQVSGGSLALNAGGAVTANIGTLTLNGGTMSTTNPVTLNVTGGNFTVNAAGSTFTGGTGAVTVSAGNLVVSAGGVTFGGTAGISGATGDGLISGGTVTNNGLLTVNRNLTMTAGTLSGTGGIQVNGAVSLSTAGTFNGNARTVTVVGNWTESAAIFAAGTSTVAMTGTSTVTATSSFYNFTVNAPTFTVTLGSPIVVSNNLTITAGTLDVSGTNYGISVGVNWSNSGAFAPRAGTVTFNGAGAIQNAESFANVTVSAGARTDGFGLTVSGLLQVSGGSLVLNAAGAVTASIGTLTLNGGTMSTTNPVTLNVTVGNFTVNAAGSTFTGGTGAVTVSAGNLVVSAGGVTFGGAAGISGATGDGLISGGTVTNNGLLTVNRNLTMTAGTLSGTGGIQVNGAVSLSTAGTFNGNARTVTVVGNWTESAAIFAAGTSTVAMTGTSTVTATSSFYNFTVNAPTFTVLLGSAITVTNNLTITAGTLDVSGTNYGISVGVNWSNSGTFTAQGGTVTFNGAAAQTVTAGGSSFYNFTVSSGANTVSLGVGGIVVSNNLSITSGTLDVTAANNYPIAVGVNWNRSGGSFLAQAGTVTFNGAGAIQNAESFANVTVSAGARTDGFGLTVGSLLQVSGGSLALNAAGAVTASIGTLTLNGGTMSTTNPVTLNVTGGNFTVNNGGSTFTGGTGAVTVSAGNLVVSAGGVTFGGAAGISGATGDGVISGGTVTNNGLLTVNRNLTMTAGTLSGTGGIQVNGAVSLSTAGTFNGNARTVTVVGNWTESAAIFAAGTSTVAMTGTSTVTATSSFYNFTVNAPTFTVLLGSAITVTNNLTITAGTLDVSGTNYGIGVGVNWSNSGTFTPHTGTVTFNGAGAQSVVAGGSAFSSFAVNKTLGTLTLGSAITVGANLTISSGTLDVSATNYAINVGGNWSNSGTFAAQSGTVTLTGAGTATIAGSTTFYNLSCTQAGKTIQFTAGTTQVIGGTLTITGVSGSLVSLVSTSAGSQWTIDPSASSSVTFALVQDSKVTGANAIAAATSRNNGNNTIAPPAPGWTFGATALTWLASAGSTDWNAAGNWSLGYVPNSGDSVTIGAGANQPTLTSAVSIAAVTVNNGAGNLTTNGFGLTVTGALAVGPGKVTATGAETISVGGDLSFTGGGTFTAGSSTVVVTGTSTVTTPSSFYNFTVSSGANTVSLGVGGIVVSNNLSITSGTLDVTAANNYPITVGVNWNRSGGSFLAQAGTVTFNGAGAIQSAESFANVTVSAGARTDGSGLTVSGLLQVSGGSLALNAGGAVTASIGTLTLNGGTMSTTNPVTLNVTGGNFTVNAAGSTFTGGTGAVTVSAGNLVVSAGGVTFGGTAGISGATGDGVISGGTLTNNALLTVNRNLVQTGGTLTGTGGIQVNGAVSLSTAGTFNGNARTVTVVGNWTESAAIFAAGTSTVAMTGTSTVTTTNSFYNFTVNAPTFTVLLGSAITVTNNLTITAGTLDVSGTNYGITVAVNWSDSGTFAPRAGTVTFNNAGAVQSVESFANVTVSAGARTDGFGLTVGSLLQVSGGSLALNGAVTASIGTLTLNGGTMSTANPVTLNVTVGNFTVNAAGSTFTGGTGAVTVSAGNLVVSAGAPSFGGTVTVSGASGQIQISGGTTVFSAAASTTGGTAADCTISGGTLTNNALLTVNRNLVQTGGTLTGTGGIQVNGAVSLSTAGTFNGNARTVTVKGNWTESAAIFTAGTSTVVVTGTSTVTTTNSFYNFTVNASGLTVTLGSAIVVTNNLTITAGTLDVSGTNYGITVGVNWSDSGTFAPRAGTVTFNNAGAVQSVESFANVTVSAGARTDGFGLTVGSLLQVSGGSLALNGAVTASIGTLTLNGGTMSTANPVTLNVTVGNFTVNNGGSTFTGGTGAVTVSAGNLVVSAGAPSFGGTVTVSGASGQIQISGGTTVFSAAASTTGGTAADCTISGGTLTNNALLTVNRNLVQTGGTLTGTGGIQVNGAVSLSTAGTFNGNARTVTVVGGWTESAAIYAAGSSTVVMAGTSTVTTTNSFYNFTVNASGLTVTLGSAIVVTNNLTITAGTLDVSGTNYGITVGVNWSDSGTFAPRAGTVTFNNAGAVQSVESFANVTVSAGARTDGFGLTVSGLLQVSGGSLALNGAVTANIGTLTLNGGTMSTTNPVTLNVTGGNFTVNAAGSTFTGGTGAVTVSAGNLVVSAGAPSFGGTVTVSGASGQIQVSGGTTVFSAAASTTGGTAADCTISGGTLTNNALLTVNRNLVQTGGTLTGTGGIQVNGAVSLSTAGTFNGNARTVTVKGGWTESAAIFAAGSSTVVMAGTSTVTTTNSFYNFTVNAPTFTVLLGSAIVVTNNLTITAGTLDVSGTNYGITVGVNWSDSGTFAPRAGTVTFNNAGAVQSVESFANVTVSAGARTDGFGLTVGSLLQVSGGSLALNGAVTASIGTLTLNGGTMSTTNPVTLNVTVGNFTVNAAGSTFTGGTGAVTVSAGNLVVSAGAPSFGGTVTVSGASGQIQISGGTTVFSAAASTTGGTAADCTISGGTLTNNALLTVNRNLVQTGGTLTGTGGIQVNGAVSLSTAGTFNGNARTVTVVGGWTESAAIYAAGSSTVVMAGTSTVTTTNSFYNFTVNAPTFTVLLGSAIVVTNNLTITAGTLDVSGTNYGITVGVNWSDSGTFAPRAGTVTFNNAGAVQSVESFANVTVSAGARTDGFGLTVGSLLQVSGGSLALNGAVTASIGTLTLNGGTMSTTNPVTLNVTVGNFTVNAAGSTFTGGTGAVTVSAGNLVVSAGGVTFGGAAGISGATGDGVISGGTVTNNGLLTVNRNLTMTGGTLSGTGGIQVNGAVSLSTAGTFNGNARTVTVVGNWTESAAIFAAGTSTVVMAGSSTVTATSSFYNFTVDASGLTVTLGSAITASNDLTITAGTLDVSGTSYGITVGVNWSDSGTFTPRAGTVTFNGTGAIQNAESFANVTVSAGARTDGFGLTVGSLLQVSGGSLALNAAGAVTANIGTLTLNGGTMSTANPVTLNVTVGNFTVNAAGSTFTGGTGAVTVSAGNLAVSAGAPSFGGTVTVSGASGQIQISGGTTVFSAAASTTGATAADCVISGGTLTNNALLSVRRDLVQTGGTLSGTGGVQVGRNVALSTGGTFNGGARTVTVTGNWTESAAIFAAGSSTVVMAGSSTVTTTNSFYNFTVSAGASTVSLGSGIVVSNDVVITSGTLDASLSGFGITVGANWTNGGAFAARSGTVTFNSAGNQSVNPGLSPFNNVTKSGGSTLGVSTNTLQVTGALTESAASDAVDVGGLDFTIGTLANAGTFRLTGTQTTQSLGSIAFTGNVQYYGAGGSIRINVPFNSLEIAGSGTFTLAGNIQVGPNTPTVGTGALKITSGKLDTSAAYHSITVNGDWNNAVGNAGFNPEQATVFFTKPSGTINVSGNTSWYVFDCEVPGITLVFQAGATQTFANVIATTPAGNPFFRVKGTSGAGVIAITSSNPSASAVTANYWVFTLQPEAQLDMIYVSIDCSWASPFDVPVPNNVTLASPPVTQCPGWRSPNLVVFSGTVDSDHDGKIDRILVHTQFSLSRGAPGSFSGFQVRVTGYTLNTQGGYEGTPFSWASLPDDREFYILLKEQPTLDTGVTPSWTILQNNTLVDSAGQGRYVELSGPSQTSDDTAPPVIAYTLAVADKDQVFVAFSEPVEYDPSGSGAGARAIQAGDFQYAGGAAITGMQRITTDGGLGTSEALFTLAGPVTATEEVTGAAISVKVPQSVRDMNALDPVNGPPVGTQPAPGTTVHSALFSDTHRVTDVGLGLNAGPEYGVIEPAYAKDQTITSTPGVGYIVAFDGTRWLQPQTITVEGRLHSLGAPFTPAGPDPYPGASLWWDVNVASSSLAADGFWLPPFDASAFNGAVPFADDAASAEAGTVVDTQHRSFVIPPDPRIVDGATVQFMFQILPGPGVPNNLYSAHVQDPNAADWYRHLLPWSFQIHLVRAQRGGASILNNVIDPDKGDVATLQYILGTSGQVTVIVFDLSGSIVNVLARANQAAGEYSVTWDGRNRGGRAVARGIYFVRVVGPNLDETRKVLVVR